MPDGVGGWWLVLEVVYFVDLIRFFDCHDNPSSPNTE